MLKNPLKQRSVKKLKRTVYYELKTVHNSYRKRRVVNNFKDSPRYLNIGGGEFVRENWRVLDHILPRHYNYPKIFVDFNIDLEKGEKWPIGDGTYDLAYISHTLEHLSPAAVISTLKEAQRILKPNGGLRITGPDINLALEYYENNDRIWFEMHYPDLSGRPLEDFLLEFFASRLVAKIPAEDVRKDFLSMSRGDFFEKYCQLRGENFPENNPGYHKNWFDYEKLEQLLKAAGFAKVIRRSFRQSIFTEMCHKEFDQTAPEISLFIDAVK